MTFSTTGASTRGGDQFRPSCKCIVVVVAVVVILFFFFANTVCSS